MNVAFDMKYLNGSNANTFGENNGTSVVYTNIRQRFDIEKPNVAKFLKNYQFLVSMMNEIMAILIKKRTMKHVEAVLKWLKKHPEIYRAWLKGIKTVDGKEALAAFEKYLKKEKI